MSLDHLSKTYGCKTKTLYPFENFAIGDFNKIKGDLSL